MSFRSRDTIYFRFRVRHFEIHWSVDIADCSVMSALSPVLRTWSKIFGFLKEFCLMTLVFNIVHTFMTFRPFWLPSWTLEVSRDQGKIVVLWTNLCHTKCFLPCIDISHRWGVTSRWMLCGVILPPPPRCRYTLPKKPLPVWGLMFIINVAWLSCPDCNYLLTYWQLTQMGTFPPTMHYSLVAAILHTKEITSIINQRLLWIL